MRTSTLSERLRESTLDLAWRQWTALGVAGTSTWTDRAAIDPEALLLFSLEVGRWDPRLYDEILDWLAANGEWLSPPRLKNLAQRSEPGSLWAAMSWTRAEDPSLRWSIPSAPRDGEPEDLFPGLDVSVLPAGVDEHFAAYGYLRPRIARSGKSRPPDLGNPAALALRLRALFGPGSRPELVRYLLTMSEREATASDAAEAAAFSKRVVQESLLGLTGSGTVKARWRGNERQYSLDRDRWAFLLRLPTREIPRYVDWPRLLRVVSVVVRWVQHDDSTERSEYVRASEARRLIHALASDLLALGVRPPDDGRHLGEAYWGAFVDTVERLLDHLR
jgi:hypothetical protein